MQSYAFDPDAVASAEAAGWRAYYDRNWPAMLKLMLRLNREQFHMPLLASSVAAWYTIQASRKWIPPRVDPDMAEYYLSRFYGLARAHSGLRFDPIRAGALELAYWDIARRYRDGAPREEFVQRLADLHAEIFGITPEQARESAELRVQAAELVDQINAGIATDPEGNWRELEERLRGCYLSVQHEMGTGARVA